MTVNTQDQLPIEYSITDARIAELRDYLELTVDGLDDKHGLEVVTARHQEVKGLRLSLIHI